MPTFYNNSIDSPITLSIQRDFSGGQFSAYDTSKIKENGVSYAENCILNRVGEIETRPGYTSLGASSLGVIECIGAYNTDSTEEAIIFSGGSTFKYNGSTISGISGYSYNDGGNDIMVAQSGNKLYAVDGLNKLYYYDGTSWTANEVTDTNPAPSLMSIIISHKGKLILYGKDYGRETILISDIHLDGLPEFDRNLWSFDVANDGTKITAMCSWFDSYFAVFKRNKTYVVKDVYYTDEPASAASWEVSIADNNVGCVAKKTAVHINGEIIFLSDDGVRKLLIDNDLNKFFVTPTISEPISDVINRINKAYIHMSHAIQRGNRYILYLPLDSSTVCNYAIVWNQVMNEGRGGWEGLYSGENISALSTVEISGENYMFAGDSDGVFYVSSDYKSSDEVGSIDYDTRTVITTRAFDFGEQFNYKRIRHVESQLKHSFSDDGTVDLYGSIDGGDFFYIRSFSISTGGVSFPITFPIMFSESKYFTKKASLEGKNRFKNIAFKIVTEKGRLTLRDISSAAFIKTIWKEFSTDDSNQ